MCGKICGIAAVAIAALIVNCNADPHQEQDVSSNEHGSLNQYDARDRAEVEDILRYLMRYENQLDRNLNGIGGVGRSYHGDGMGRTISGGLGGSSLVGRNLGGTTLLGRNLNGVGGSTLLGLYEKRFLDPLGGSNFVRNLDSLGGGNFVRNLDSLGGANLVKRNLDALGGANFVKKNLDQLGGPNLVKRTLDALGGANFVRQLDPLGGPNLV